MEYNEAAYRHFMNVGNTYLFGKAVDESVRMGNAWRWIEFRRKGRG